MYKLIAIDLDDTLLNNQWEIGEKDKKALLQAKEAGVMVVLATGRMYRAALKYAKELSLKTPMIVYQGALVINYLNQEIIKQYSLPLDKAIEVIEEVAPYGYHINLYEGDELIIAKQTKESLRYEEMSGCKARVVGNLKAYLKKEQIAPIKILVATKEEELDLIIPSLKEKFGSSLHIAKSKPYFLEFSHPLANKGHALAELALQYGIKPEEIIAIGDGYNDIEMISFAGLGVAMGNGCLEVKKIADYITSSNLDGGVSKVINEFILKK